MGISTLASYKGLKFLKLLVLITQSLIDVLLVLHLESKVSRLNTLLKMPLHYTKRGIQPETPSNQLDYLKLVNIIGDGGDAHINDPAAIASLQDAVRNKNERAYGAYAKKENEATVLCVGC